MQMKLLHFIKLNHRFERLFLCGREKSKGRVVVLVVSKMTSNERLLFLVTRELLKPRCFQNIKILLTEYESCHKAWTTGRIRGEGSARMHRTACLKSYSLQPRC